MMVRSPCVRNARRSRDRGAKWQMNDWISVVRDSEANWHQCVVFQGVIIIANSWLSKCIQEQVAFACTVLVQEHCTCQRCQRASKRMPSHPYFVVGVSKKTARFTTTILGDSS